MRAQIQNLTKRSPFSINKETVLYARSLTGLDPNFPKWLEEQEKPGRFAKLKFTNLLYFKPIERVSAFFQASLTNTPIIERVNLDKIKETIDTLVRSTFELDSTTGYLTNQHAPLITAMAHTHAQLNHTHTMMLEGDALNLGGTNLHFLKAKIKEAPNLSPADRNRLTTLAALKNTDPAQFNAQFASLPIAQQELFNTLDAQARNLTDLVLKALCLKTAEILESHGAQILPFRNGGDEFRIIASELKAKHMQGIQKKIIAAQTRLLKPLGLCDHQHHKKQGVNGTGIAFAFFDLQSLKPAEFKKSVEDQIDTVKSTINTHYQKQRMNRRKSELPSTPDIEKALKDQIQALEQSVNYTDRFTKQTAVIKTAERKSEYELPHNTQKRALKSLLSSDLLGQEFKSLSGEIKRSIVNTIKFTQRRDHATGAFLPGEESTVIANFSADDARLQGKFKDATLHSRFCVLNFDNLSGLNEVLGHEGANHLLEQISRIINTKFAEKGINNIHLTHKGGARFGIVVPAVRIHTNDNQNTYSAITDKEVRDLLEAVMNKVLTDINNIQISVLIEKLSLDPKTVSQNKASLVLKKAHQAGRSKNPAQRTFSANYDQVKDIHSPKEGANQTGLTGSFSVFTITPSSPATANSFVIKSYNNPLSSQHPDINVA